LYGCEADEIAEVVRARLETLVYLDRVRRVHFRVDKEPLIIIQFIFLYTCRPRLGIFSLDSPA
jgi:hypothetical protein